MADKVVLEAEVKSNIGEVSKDASSLAGEFKIMGVSLNGVKAGFVSIGKAAKASFATIKAGIMSTGIGALVLAVASLASFFTNTKRGADQLTQAFTAMGAVVDVLTDRLSKVGEAISFVFSGEFRKAGEALKGTFSGITEEIKGEVAAMVALKKRTQELRDADMEFMVQKAATRQEIEKARLNAEDETKSATERLDALKTALSLEEKTTQRELELAAERLAIQKEEMALSENSAEDEERLAQLKVELIEKETASVKMRRRVVTEVNSLEREILAEEKARAKEKQDIIDEEQKAKIDALDKAAKKEVELAKKVASEKKAILKAEESFKKATISAGFGAAAAMAGENVALSKGVAAAQVIYNTQQGIMAAMGATSIADKLLPYPLRLANAIATGVMGAAALSKIMSTNPSGGASAGGGASAASSGSPAPQMMSGAFDLTGGIEPEPVQAFVVTDEMTNSQNQLANIRRRATI
tara:strand:- start:53 stop:1462 length:1410 start_codon:yes stop_codon:yes gene_type:complete